jgi:predicted DCC family thiol-disulfide oxidoreductase YuxK
MTTPTVVFDGDCAFCTSSAQRLVRWSRGGVRIVPWQRADLPSLDLTEAQCRAAVQFVGPGGVRSGGAAIAAALGECALPWRAAAPLLRINRRFTEWCYERVASNRHRLPGGTPACAMDADQP